MPTVVENAIMLTWRSSRERLALSVRTFQSDETYLSSVFRDTDFSITVKCELYVPSSIALTGEVRPSMRSYSVLKLILSLSIEPVGGILICFDIQLRSERINCSKRIKQNARSFCSVDSLMKCVCLMGLF